jgi:hypothetical protein
MGTTMENEIQWGQQWGWVALENQAAFEVQAREGVEGGVEGRDLATVVGCESGSWTEVSSAVQE